MMNGAYKPELVSASELSETVAAAIKDAGIRIDDPVSVKWDLIGRQAQSPEEGKRLATEITGALGKAGLTAQPAVLSIGDQIICGYFEPPPIEREF